MLEPLIRLQIIIGWGFCDIQNNQGRGRDYQPKLNVEADNPYERLIVLDITKTESNNRPFPSSHVPLFQSESKCETILMKMKLRAELIFIWKVSHLDSSWNRGRGELGEGLLFYYTLNEKRWKSCFCFFTDRKQHKARNLRNHAPRSYMTWLHVT